MVQDLTWHGLQNPKLGPKPTSSQSKKDLNGKGVMDGVVPNISKTASSRVGTRSVGRPPIPNAPTVPPRDPFSTFMLTMEGIEAHEVPLPIPSTTIPTMRTSTPREKISLPFPTRSPSEWRKVRPSDFLEVGQEIQWNR